MRLPEPSIRVDVDPCNPGEFFACCGLLELADRSWGGAEGWFGDGLFQIAPAEPNGGGSLDELLAGVRRSGLKQLDLDDMTTRLEFDDSFGRLCLDWWRDEQSEHPGSDLKTWAGQQKVVRIAKAMLVPAASPQSASPSLFGRAAVLFDPSKPRDTVGSFYFDSRRAAQAQSLDIGFSPDAHQMTMPVYSAAEFFCLVGLKRFRPRPNENRAFEYATWAFPLAPSAARLVAAGMMRGEGVQRYRFRLLYRTKYLKGFLPATPIRGES